MTDKIRSRIAYGLIAYIALVFLHAGIINADFRGEFSDFRYRCTAKDGRGHLAFSFGMAMVPIFWIISPFMTGFYQHGWTLNSGAWGGCLSRAQH